MKKFLFLSSFTFVILFSPLFAQDLQEVKEEKLLKQEQFKKQEELHLKQRQLKQEQLKKEKEVQFLLQKAQTLQHKTESLSEEESQAIYKYFNQFDKDALLRLDELKDIDINLYKNQLNHLYFEKMHLERIQEENPGRFKDALEIRKLDSESHQLSKDYRLEKDNSKKGEIEKRLKKILNELFDLRENEKKIEMERIEDKLNSLAEEINKRRENKKIIIENRFKQLTGQDRVYEW